MHLSRALRSLLVICLCGFASLLTAGPAEDAHAALRRSIDEVSTALRERPPQDDLVALLDTLAEKHFAFATATRLAVGPAWREFSAAERARSAELFSRLLVRTYSSRIKGDAPPDMTFGAATELRPGRVEVPTTVRFEGNTYSVIYRMELDSASKNKMDWRVYDVIGEGVSLVGNYRSQFEPIVRSSGAAGLIRSLEAKLAEPIPAPEPLPAPASAP